MITQKTYTQIEGLKLILKQKMGWNHLAQDTEKWQVIVNKTMSL